MTTREIIESNLESIKRATLTRNLTFVDHPPIAEHVESFEINGVVILIGISRVKG